MLNFNWYTFSELTLEQLYAVLALRANVFVVEQQCAYLDPDGKDSSALHLLGMHKDKLVAYLRLFPPTTQESFLRFGRVVTDKSSRSQGYGKLLMHELLTYCQANFPNLAIKCSAQFYLKNFYESFGFTSYGHSYLEDEIPHIAMQKTP
jgi:ElaA protein